MPARGAQAGAAAAAGATSRGRRSSRGRGGGGREAAHTRSEDASSLERSGSRSRRGSTPPAPARPAPPRPPCPPTLTWAGRGPDPGQPANPHGGPFQTLAPRCKLLRPLASGAQGSTRFYACAAPFQRPESELWNIPAPGGASAPLPFALGASGPVVRGGGGVRAPPPRAVVPSVRGRCGRRGEPETADSRPVLRPGVLTHTHTLQRKHGFVLIKSSYGSRRDSQMVEPCPLRLGLGWCPSWFRSALF